MTALSTWATDVSDHEFGDLRSFTHGNNRTRPRETSPRSSSDHLDINSFMKMPRSTGNEFQSNIQPPNGSMADEGGLAFSFPLPHDSLPEMQQSYRKFPGQFELSAFDTSLEAFSSPSPSGESLMDQWDCGLSARSDFKRPRLSMSSPMNKFQTPVGLSSIRDSLPLMRERKLHCALPSSESQGNYINRSFAVPPSGPRGVDVQGINEMLSRFNPPVCEDVPAPSTQFQSHNNVVSRSSLEQNLDSFVVPDPLIPPPLFDSPLLCPGSDHSGLASLKSLEDGFPSHGLSVKGLSSFGTAHDANTMEQLLVLCAEALESKDVNLAHQIMWVLNNIVSAEGDPNQRVTSCFLKALVRRAGRMVPSLNAGLNAMYGAGRVSKTVSAVEYAVMVDITPWYRFGFKAANGAMLEAFEGKDRIHVVDFTTTYGMQWPTLIEALAWRAEGPPHVHLTVHKARPDVPPFLGMTQEDVIKRLMMFAQLMKVQLEVEIISQEIELLDHSTFNIRDDEITVVNCMYRARYIPDENGPPGPAPCSRDMFFKLVHSLNPALVTLVDEEATVTSPSLVARLKAAFNYMWIPFDSLDTFLPRDSPQRVEYELDLAKKIEDIIVSEGLERIERMETKDKWGERMKKSGFELVPFSEDVVEEVRTMLVDHAASWGMKQDEDSILLTWKGHNVLFATMWRPSSHATGH